MWKDVAYCTPNTWTGCKALSTMVQATCIEVEIVGYYVLSVKKA